MFNLRKWCSIGLFSVVLSSLFSMSLVSYSQYTTNKQIAQRFESKSRAFDELSLSYSSLEGMIQHLEREFVGTTFTVESTSNIWLIVRSTEFEVGSIDYPAYKSHYDAMFVLDETPLGITLVYHHDINGYAVTLITCIQLIISILVLNCGWYFNRVKGKDTEHKNNEEQTIRLRELNFSPHEQEMFNGFGAFKAMDDRSIQWFIWAYRRYGCIDKSMSVATSSDSLEFDINNRTIRIRGNKLELPKTVFFYYYWYAQRKAQHFGPYTNPASNKPDLSAGQELARIMAKYDGIDRTIEELKLIGVRAKNLDLNRNKIKERLTAEFGELSELYLFESKRDPRVARYQYQLILDREKIQLLT